MSRGGWRVKLAIGIIVVCAATLFAALILSEASNSQSFYEQQAAQNAKTYQETARIHAERSCGRLTPAEAFECRHREYHAARERERQERDLQAQLVTSAWTRAMGLAAIVAMVVGIIGVGLVYVTFDETRETNRIARRTGVVQLRAYLSVGRPTLRKIDAGRWSGYLPVANTGQTPATEVDVSTSCALVPFPVTREHVEGLAHRPLRMANIGPHSERGRGYVHQTTPDTWARVIAGTACYIYRLQFSYTTYTGERVEEAESLWIAREPEFAEGTLSTLSEHHYRKE